MHAGRLCALPRSGVIVADAQIMLLSTGNASRRKGIVLLFLTQQGQLWPNSLQSLLRSANKNLNRKKGSDGDKRA